ncbi:universal stress protein [Amycolatopsis suaedae]|uniref:Universal stress protein n=1 Tax=Amycolatopsis suaedae TaxID=2510978 RepID=A0A4Q7JFD9_9PSEU|nr:universal stress protein [Amycolatopsis suaedae]RZQ65902.1 universal stress protein [Amycolatopsis suaedae]
MNSTENRPAVVVGVDGSEQALHAVRWAACEAVRRAVPLRLFHACYVPPATYVPVALPRSYADAVAEQGRALLARAEEVAVEAAPGVETRRELRSGVAAGLLVHESKEAALIVLGSRGLGGFTGLLVGSVAVEVARHGHCPVVVVRGKKVEDVPPTTGPVVVGVDGSPVSDAAVGYAFEAASARGVPLIAVHVWNDVTLDQGWALMPISIDYEQIAAEQARLLRENLAGWREKFPGVEVVERVDRDRPARALLRHAAGAQLLVVGSHGMGGFAGMVLGSVSQAALHHSPCPVAVIRPEPAT